MVNYNFEYDTFFGTIYIDFWKNLMIYSCISDSDIMLALDSRAFDRLAKDFLQKEKRKL